LYLFCPSNTKLYLIKKNGWVVREYNLTSALLHGKLKEIYMDILPRFKGRISMNFMTQPFLSVCMDDTILARVDEKEKESLDKTSQQLI
jgi:hypothetical protein